MSSDPKPAGNAKVRPVAKHRRFTTEDKLRILTAYEGTSTPQLHRLPIQLHLFAISHTSLHSARRFYFYTQKDVTPPSAPYFTPSAKPLTKFARSSKNRLYAMPRKI
jgi:hypothetical protein